MRANTLRRKLYAGGKASGCWLFTGSPENAEILALCGFDALIVDHEHSPGSFDATLGQFRAIAPTSTTALVRLGHCTQAEIKRVLDLGAEGIIIPNAEDVVAVEALVSASHYSPRGNRGAHFTVSRAARWGFDAASYFDEASNEILVVAMIESARGVSAIPEIAGCAGVDMLFIGPLDLSGSIDRMGQYSDPAFGELLEEAERRTIEAGMLLGGSIIPGQTAADLFARGYSFVTPTSDVALLRDEGKIIAQTIQTLGI